MGKSHSPCSHVHPSHLALESNTMRQFLNQSLEALREPAHNVVSLEEEQDMLVEAAGDQAGIEADLGEVDRVSDMSDALEDLAVIADGIEGDATGNEAALMDTAGQMAVAGTDVDAAELVTPSLESNGARRYSAESLRERAKAIWENIKRFLKEIWKKIESFIYKIFGTIPTLRKRVEELKKRVSDNGSKTIEEKKITVTSGVSALSQNGKTPSTDTELRSNFLHMLNVNKGIFGDNIDSGIRVGEAVLDGLNDFDADAPDESGKKFVEKVKKAMAGAKAGYKTSKTSGARFGEQVEAEISDPLLGNISIVHKKPTYISHAPGTASTVGMLENMRGYAVEVCQTSDKAKESPSSFEMATATNASMSAMLDDALEQLDVLEKFQRGKRASEMKSLRGKLETASEKASNSMKKLEGKDDAAEKLAVPYYRAMLNYNQSYTRWMKDPALPMVSHTLASIRGVMTVVNKSLSNYK